MIDEPLVPLPEKGRIYRARRRVLLADAAPSRRMRFDAFARFLQDIGNDDTADSGLDDVAEGLWVVRRAVIDVIVPPRWNEWLDLATWCGGVGPRWAERRLTLTGDDGGLAEMTTLWVHVNTRTMVPAPVPPAFKEIYGEAAGGRRISASHWLRPPEGWRDGSVPTVPAPASAMAAEASGAFGASGTMERFTWPLRAVDYDVMRHVNNAAYWAAVEELLASRPGRGPHPRRGTTVRGILEYGPGIGPGADVDLLVDRTDTTIAVWFVVDGTIAATAHLTEL
jgi:acyl-ACP thioesterase